MPDHDLKPAARAMAAQILGPLARLLLDIGLSAKDLQEIARMEFVRAALAKGAASAPPATTDSHIAVVTGLTRRDVARLRASPPRRDKSDAGRHRAEVVLKAWVSGDTAFQDRGEPARLPLRGTRFSFAALVRKHSPEPRARTILRDLERVKAVRRTPDNLVEVIRKTYAPLSFSPEGLRELGEQCQEHLQTLIHNLHHPKRPLYQRRALNRKLTPNQAAILTRSIVMQADAALDAIDSALSDPPLDPTDTSAVDSVAVGLGLYLIQEPGLGELDSAAPGAPQRTNREGFPRSAARAARKRRTGA